METNKTITFRSISTMYKKINLYDKYVPKGKLNKKIDSIKLTNVKYDTKQPSLFIQNTTLPILKLKVDNNNHMKKQVIIKKVIQDNSNLISKDKPLNKTINFKSIQPIFSNLNNNKVLKYQLDFKNIEEKSFYNNKSIFKKIDNTQNVNQNLISLNSNFNEISHYNTYIEQNILKERKLTNLNKTFREGKVNIKTKDLFTNMSNIIMRGIDFYDNKNNYLSSDIFKDYLSDYFNKITINFIKSLIKNKKNKHKKTKSTIEHEMLVLSDKSSFKAKQIRKRCILANNNNYNNIKTIKCSIKHLIDFYIENLKESDILSNFEQFNKNNFFISNLLNSFNKRNLLSSIKKGLVDYFSKYELFSQKSILTKTVFINKDIHINIDYKVNKLDKGISIGDHISFNKNRKENFKDKNEKFFMRYITTILTEPQVRELIKESIEDISKTPTYNKKQVVVLMNNLIKNLNLDPNLDTIDTIYNTIRSKYQNNQTNTLLSSSNIKYSNDKLVNKDKNKSKSNKSNVLRKEIHNEKSTLNIKKINKQEISSKNVLRVNNHSTSNNVKKLKFDKIRKNHNLSNKKLAGRHEDHERINLSKPIKIKEESDKSIVSNILKPKKKRRVSFITPSDSKQITLSRIKENEYSSSDSSTSIINELNSSDNSKFLKSSFNKIKINEIIHDKRELMKSFEINKKNKKAIKERIRISLSKDSNTNNNLNLNKMNNSIKSQKEDSFDTRKEVKTKHFKTTKNLGLIVNSESIISKMNQNYFNNYYSDSINYQSNQIFKKHERIVKKAMKEVKVSKKTTTKNSDYYLKHFKLGKKNTDVDDSISIHSELNFKISKKRKSLYNSNIGLNKDEQNNISKRDVNQSKSGKVSFLLNDSNAPLRNKRMSVIVNSRADKRKMSIFNNKPKNSLYEESLQVKENMDRSKSEDNSHLMIANNEEVDTDKYLEILRKQYEDKKKEKLDKIMQERESRRTSSKALIELIRKPSTRESKLFSKQNMILLKMATIKNEENKGELDDVDSSINSVFDKVSKLQARHSERSNNSIISLKSNKLESKVKLDRILKDKSSKLKNLFLNKSIFDVQENEVIKEEPKSKEKQNQYSSKVMNLEQELLYILYSNDLLSKEEQDRFAEMKEHLRSMDINNNRCLNEASLNFNEYNNDIMNINKDLEGEGLLNKFIRNLNEYRELNITIKSTMQRRNHSIDNNKRINLEQLR